MIAALYVETGGCYFGLDGVDPWDEARDARTYVGPAPGGGAPAVPAVGQVLARQHAQAATSTSWVTTADASRLRCKPCRYGGVLEHPRA